MYYELNRKGDQKMIVLDIRTDNFYSFKDFHMNMSYPKKTVNSYIPDEYLMERPNFRYKKINILLGANASGKTSVGKMLMDIFNFIYKKQYTTIVQKINNPKKEAYFSMDFITSGVNYPFLYRKGLLASSTAVIVTPVWQFSHNVSKRIRLASPSPTIYVLLKLITAEILLS